MHRMSAVAAAVAALAGAAQAQLIITDAEPGAFIDITATGIPLGLGDDEEVSIPLSIFLGNDIVPAGSVLTVANNGGVGVNVAMTDLSPVNAPLPSSLAFGGDTCFLPFWDDPGSDFGDVFFEERLELVIIQWERNFNGGPPGNMGSWQVQIPSDEVGTCYSQYLYRDIERQPALGGAISTIGFQGQGSPQFNTVQWSFNHKFAVQDGTVLSVCLVPGPGTAGLLALAGIAALRRRRA